MPLPHHEGRPLLQHHSPRCCRAGQLWPRCLLRQRHRQTHAAHCARHLLLAAELQLHPWLELNAGLDACAGTLTD